ncbi:D-alanyl-D-alanine endopeptidase [Pokkaliibacter sp. CJK22405]|uniref:D-alanyl-D-alanine endopeptidase n=1 Tax=Pokkaliibacter sp. CJK22405 TaxID=3384615 RepID=UPI003984D0C3
MIQISGRKLAASLFIATSLVIGSPSAVMAGPKDKKPEVQEIASSSAMVFDLKHNRVIYSFNPDKIMPIASVTKLMTAMVTLDAKQSMSEQISIETKSNPFLENEYSRVRVGSTLSRKEVMLLALMSSENRAASSLAEHYPGGYKAFIKAMNAKAKRLGMKNTHYEDPTGLSPNNVSTARDLTRLLVASRQYPMLTELSTTVGKDVIFKKPTYRLHFANTNRLLRYDKDWKIALTKTGYTDEAGHCLVMRTYFKGVPVTTVTLNAYGKYTHFADAQRLRHYLETGESTKLPESVVRYRDARIREAAALESSVADGT